MKRLLMGIDLGTTHIKAGIFDIHGKQEALSIMDNTMLAGDNGCSYYDPDAIKSKVFKAISDAVKMVEGPFVLEGISVASMAESGVPVDHEGKPLYYIIPWFDQRTLPQGKWWNDNIELYEIYKITGLRLQPKYTINKIMWLKENMPQVYKRMHKWLCMEDYIIFCLTGEYATDASLANRTMAMDVKSRTWSEKLLDMAGIDKNKLPEIYKSGTIVGCVTPETSKVLMVKQGTPVVTGGHDHPCAALASGAVEDGDVFDSMGTAETIVAVKDNAEFKKEMFEAGLSVGRYVDGDRFYYMGGMQGSGASVEWFGRNFMGPGDKRSMYSSIEELSNSMDRDPSGLFFLPHLRGSGAPNVDPEARGAFIGLGSDHTKAHMLKAIYEGTSFEFRLMKDYLKDISGINPPVLRVGGGSTKNTKWMEIKANAVGMNLDIPLIEESAAMGAALLAGIGVGIYKNGKDAFTNLDIAHRIVNQDMNLSEKYHALYKDGYRNLYKLLKGIKCKA